MNGILLSLIMAIVMVSASLIYVVVKNSIENKEIPETQMPNTTTIPSINITILPTDIDMDTKETDSTDLASSEKTSSQTDEIDSTTSEESKNLETNTPEAEEAITDSLETKTNVKTSIEAESDKENQTSIVTDEITSEPLIVYYSACDSSYISFVDALKSIGEDSSYANRKKIAEINGISDYSGTSAQNLELLDKLKKGELIKSISQTDAKTQSQIEAQIENKETQEVKDEDSIIPFQTLYSQIEINDMIKKLEESSLENEKKKSTLIIMAPVLLNYGFELSFVAGVLGNIYSEGEIGKFENSNYVSNPTLIPNYLKYMNDNYSYLQKYSNKYIYDLSLSEIKALLEELEKNGWKGKFGLGCVQWTGDRTLNLVNYYLKETGNKDEITFEQACSSESKLIIWELSNSYKGVYDNWKQ